MSFPSDGSSPERVIQPINRDLDKIMSLHKLDLNEFEGATVYDLGCGNSDVGAELALRGIEACVWGFDHNKDVVATPKRSEASTKRIFAPLNRLPVEDETADIVLATFSLPYHGRNALEITEFYGECERTVKIGGLLSVYPIIPRFSPDASLHEYEERTSATKNGADKIRQSADWRNLETINEALLKARKQGRIKK